MNQSQPDSGLSDNLYPEALTIPDDEETDLAARQAAYSMRLHLDEEHDRILRRSFE